MKKNSKKIISVLFAVILIFGILGGNAISAVLIEKEEFNAEAENMVTVEDDGVSLSAYIDESSYDNNETVKISYSLTNNNDFSIYKVGSGSLDWLKEITISEKESGEKYSYKLSGIVAIGQFELLPGETFFGTRNVKLSEYNFLESEKLKNYIFDGDYTYSLTVSYGTEKANYSASYETPYSLTASGDFSITPNPDAQNTLPSNVAYYMQDGILLEAYTDKQVYSVNDEINLTYDITNLNEETIYQPDSSGWSWLSSVTLVKKNDGFSNMGAIIEGYSPVTVGILVDHSLEHNQTAGENTVSIEPISKSIFFDGTEVEAGEYDLIVAFDYSRDLPESKSKNICKAIMKAGTIKVTEDGKDAPTEAVLRENSVLSLQDGIEFNASTDKATYKLSDETYSNIMSLDFSFKNTNEASIYQKELSDRFWTTDLYIVKDGTDTSTLDSGDGVLLHNSLGLLRDTTLDGDESTNLNRIYLPIDNFSSSEPGKYNYIFKLTYSHLSSEENNTNECVEYFSGSFTITDGTDNSEKPIDKQEPTEAPETPTKAPSAPSDTDKKDTEKPSENKASDKKSDAKKTDNSDKASGNNNISKNNNGTVKSASDTTPNPSTDAGNIGYQFTAIIIMIICLVLSSAAIRKRKVNG